MTLLSCRVTHISPVSCTFVLKLFLCSSVAARRSLLGAETTAGEMRQVPKFSCSFVWISQFGLWEARSSPETSTPAHMVKTYFLKDERILCFHRVFHLSVFLSYTPGFFCKSLSEHNSCFYEAVEIKQLSAIMPNEVARALLSPGLGW